MTKLSTLNLCAFFILLLCYGCRTEDDFIQQRQSNPDGRFAMFVPKHAGQQIDYTKGFAALMLRYDSLRGTNLSGKVNTLNRTAKIKALNAITVTENNEPYVEFRIHSQTVTAKNGDKWAVFAKVLNNKVEDLKLALLSKNETYLGYRDIDRKSSFYKQHIPLFQKAADELFGKSHTSLFNKTCGQDEEYCEIEPVIITIPKTPPNEGGDNGEQEPPVDQGGGCSIYLECDNPDPGGGGPADNPFEPQNPCEKAKAIVNNPKIANQLQELKNQSQVGGEKGFKVGKDGAPSSIINGGPHNVNFGDKMGYAGGYHNHTPTGISMFSPQDIDELLSFARQPDNLSTAFMGMVATNGNHYVITFTGDYNDALKTFSQEQIDLFYENMQTRNSLYRSSDSTDGLEKLFAKTLKEMGLLGKIQLQKAEANGEIKSININADGTLSPSTQCN